MKKEKCVIRMEKRLEKWSPIIFYQNLTTDNKLFWLEASSYDGHHEFTNKDYYHNTRKPTKKEIEDTQNTWLFKEEFENYKVVSRIPSNIFAQEW